MIKETSFHVSRTLGTRRETCLIPPKLKQCRLTRRARVLCTTHSARVEYRVLYDSSPEPMKNAPFDIAGLWFRALSV
jgi:hypothetical protein